MIHTESEGIEDIKQIIMKISRVAILISHTLKMIKRDKDHCIMIKGSVHQEDITG